MNVGSVVEVFQEDQEDSVDVRWRKSGTENNLKVGKFEKIKLKTKKEG